MRPKTTKLMALTAMTAALALPAKAQDATADHPIPQSEQLEHQDTMAELTALSHRRGPIGEAATKALELYKAHVQRENAYILPPLSLLPMLADGKVTPDMAWALPMIDRVKAEHEEIFQEHTKITDAMSALHAAGQHAHDQHVQDFAEAAVADSLNDLEILEPTVLLIGEYLRSKLPNAH